MTIEADIYSALSGDATVSGLVSARIYPVKLPQEPTYPAVMYERRDAIRETALGGRCALTNTIFNIDCYATTFAGARALMDAVRIAMEGATAFDSVTGGDVDIYEDDTDLYVSSMEFSIWHNEDLT